MHRQGCTVGIRAAPAPFEAGSLAGGGCRIAKLRIAVGSRAASAQIANAGPERSRNSANCADCVAQTLRMGLFQRPRSSCRSATANFRCRQCCDRKCQSDSVAINEWNSNRAIACDRHSRLNHSHTSRNAPSRSIPVSAAPKATSTARTPAPASTSAPTASSALQAAADRSTVRTSATAFDADSPRLLRNSSASDNWSASARAKTRPKPSASAASLTRVADSIRLSARSTLGSIRTVAGSTVPTRGAPEQRQPHSIQHCWHRPRWPPAHAPRTRGLRPSHPATTRTAGTTCGRDPGGPGRSLAEVRGALLPRPCAGLSSRSGTAARWPRR